MAKDVKPGDLVWVFESWNRNGGPERYAVAKVGRTLAHISMHGRTEAFRLDTGRLNDGRGSTYFRTQAEMDERERIAAATGVLEDAGIELRLGLRPPLALLEALAATVAEYQRTETTEVP